MSLTADDARRLERVIAAGGVAIIPTDTVYGLACDPDSEAAAAALYGIKGRDEGRPAAVMFFNLDSALAACDWLGDRTRRAVEKLLPGPYTLLVPNPRGLFAAACRGAPQTLGLRVPDLAGPTAALSALTMPMMQSSANFSGGSDAASFAEIEPALVAAVDLALDGGSLDGRPSAVVDLSDYEGGGWTLSRPRDVADERRLRADLD